MILRVRKIARRDSITPLGKLPPRFIVWCERWWELEADFRMRLYRSAERAGGQHVIYFRRYGKKGKHENLKKCLPKRTRPR